jgi:hypothetical protein
MRERGSRGQVRMTTQVAMMTRTKEDSIDDGRRTLTTSLASERAA